MSLQTREKRSPEGQDKKEERMALLRLAQVGCGGMGLRHIYGLTELKQQGFDTFDLVALCDLHPEAANHVASEAEKGMGKRPKTYTNFDEMLEKEPDIDAVNIVTDTRMHHAFALKAFQAGKHVAVEKPMALTVRAGREMMKAAQKAGKTLSISENYRRDPMNRLVKALLQSGAIGEPRMLINIGTSGTRNVQQVAAWRHIKVRGGWGIEYGVHTSDLVLYFMGDVDRVFAETHTWEKVRYMTTVTESPQLRRFYGHRVKEELDKGQTFEVTAEDTAFAVLRFVSGAMGQLTSSISAMGARLHADIIYGSEGSITLPGSRTGRPVLLTPYGKDQPLPESEVLALAPKFELDDNTARFFEGKRRLSSYQMPFEHIDRKLIAIELQDFAEAAVKGRQPEVTGEVGLKALALSYAVLESGFLGQPVSFKAVVEDKVNAYQEEINRHAGL